MVRLGATASNSHMSLCRELETVFHRNELLGLTTSLRWILALTYSGKQRLWLNEEE